MLSQFTDNIFSACFISTIGVDFKIKTVVIDDKVVKLQIWDTAGQERFRTITTSYYRGAHGIFLVFDLNDEQSFRHIREWMGEVQRYSSPSKLSSLILIGNKSDLPRKVSEGEIAEFCAEKNMQYIETSAKDNFNIDHAFISLARNIKSKMVEIDSELLDNRPLDISSREIVDKKQSFWSSWC